jgi:hypothetical protein
MSKVLVVSKNLIGDMLCTTQVIKKFQKDNPDWNFYLQTIQSPAYSLYFGMGIDWVEIYLHDQVDESKFDRVLRFEAGKAGNLANQMKGHLVQAYATMNNIFLGSEIVETPLGNFFPYEPVYNVPNAEEIEWAIEGMFDDSTMISPFSLSCTSQEKDEKGNYKGLPPNKMLPKEKWSPILDFFRKLGPIRLLGGSDEDVPKEWKVDLVELAGVGLPIPETAVAMKKAKLVVCVDNGMGHLAASQRVPCIVLYPACLDLRFILPWGVATTVPIHMEPNTVTILQLLYQIRRAMKFLGIKEEE